MHIENSQNPFEPEIVQEVADELQGASEESRSFTLPSIVDIDGNDKLVIHIYAEGCLSCGHLFPSLPEDDYPKNSRCHFTAGNEFCPAKSLSFIPTGHLRQTASRLAKARADADTAKLISLMKKLEDLTESERQFVLSQSGLI
jgi:hypothetical protein